MASTLPTLIAMAFMLFAITECSGDVNFLEDLVQHIREPPLDVLKTTCLGCGTPLGSVTVETPLGLMEGELWDRVSSMKTAAFLGIPYAVQKRFEPSSPAGKWQGVLDARKRGPACPQGNTIPGIVLEELSEDCLFGNVFAPAAGLNGSDGTSRPVLFWLHGGGFAIGSAYSQALGKLFDTLHLENIYDGQRIAAHGNVVVMSVNYRLGVLGFTPFGDSPANLGFLDQQEGLRWAKVMARSFGGNPQKITIFGESAGGESVLFHLASPLAKDLFKYAIVESGSLDGRSLHETKQHGIKIAQKLGCSPTSILSCMKSKSYQEIISAQGSYGWLSMGTIGATIDGTALPAAMHELFASGRFNKQPMIIGNNLDEASIFGACKTITTEDFKTSVAKMYPDGSAYHQVLQLYPVDAYPDPRDAIVALQSDGIFCISNKGVADMAVKAGVPTFRYRLVRSAWFLRLLSMVSGKDAPYCMGVPHAADIIDVWGTYNLLLKITPGDLQMAQQTMRAWTNFAHSGNPNHGGPMAELSPKWNAHSNQSDTTFLFDARLLSSGTRNKVNVLMDKCPILSKAKYFQADPSRHFSYQQPQKDIMETVLV